MEDNFKIKRGRGRPLGYKLSDHTKEKIRRKRLGTHHTEETKNKISKSLIEYFKKKNSLSTSIEYEYSEISDEAVDWIYENRDALDRTEHVVTERRLLSIKQLEICLGSDIEELFGHNTTPEFLMMLKEDVQRLGYDLKELHSLI
jgi:hypothetical protein